MNTKNKYTILLLSVLFWLALTILLIHICCAAAEEYYPRAIVNVHENSYLLVRKGPSVEYDTTYVHLASKSIVSILSESNGWALVQFPALIGLREPIGWVCMDYLSYNEEAYTRWMNLGK